MKQVYFFHACLLLVTASLVFPSSTYAKPEKIVRTSMIDPIFEIDYDTSKVHFDTFEISKLRPSCNKYLSILNPLYTKLFLFAQYENEVTKIYIALAETGNEIDIYVIRNGICDGGVANFSMRQVHFNPPESSDSPALTDTEIAGLFQDALIRYEKAFGSKAVFMNKLEGTVEWKVGGCKASSKRWCSVTNKIPSLILKLLENYRNI